ncbi:MAG: PspC domain-containing protein [Bacteroidota bacterium]
MSSTKALTRSTHDRKIAGVCGGIARYFDWDPAMVRIGFVLLSLFSAAFPGVIVYIVLALIMPER